jgi:predicted esterase
MAVVLVLTLTGACSLINRSDVPNPASYRHDLPVEYYLYLPDAYNEEQAWPVFVGIHGFGGSGRDCWNQWQPYADSVGFVLVCPSLADDSGGWFQTTGEQQVTAVLQQVYRGFSIRNRAFIAGFSAGAQFAQGYAFNVPSYVSGAAILSAGNYYPPTRASSYIPFLVIIGENDDPLAVAAARDFTTLLKSEGYYQEFELIPGMGHALPADVRDLTIDFFKRVERLES